MKMDIIKLGKLASYKTRAMAKGTHRVQNTESDLIFPMHCIISRLFLVIHTMMSALLLSSSLIINVSLYLDSIFDAALSKTSLVRDVSQKCDSTGYVRLEITLFVVKDNKYNKLAFHSQSNCQELEIKNALEQTVEFYGFRK